MPVEGYLLGNLRAGDIADILGFKSRYQAEQRLAVHHVTQNHTPADRATLDRLLGPVDIIPTPS